MPLNILFWVIYLISLVVSWWAYYEPNQPWFRRGSGYYVSWVLIGILGWKVFGPAVK